MRRFLITFGVILVAGAVVLSMFLKQATSPPKPGGAQSSAPKQAAEALQPPPQDENAAEDKQSPDAGTPLPNLEGLHAVEVDPAAPAPQPLGSLDPGQAKLFMEFSLAGAGLRKITLSDFWLTAAWKNQAVAHYEALKRGDHSPPPLPPLKSRYVLQDQVDQRWGTFQIPILAVSPITINGEMVQLLWRETGTGRFESTIVDGNDRPVLQITRQWLFENDYEIALRQRVKNLTDGPLTILWTQYGPGDLTVDRARYMDRRRFRFGCLVDPQGLQGLPGVVTSSDTKLLIERQKIQKNVLTANKPTIPPARRTELRTLWPTEHSRDRGYELSWLASTNRYFGLAIYPAGDGDLSLADVVEMVSVSTPPDATKNTAIIFVGLSSPVRTLAGGEETAFDVGVYAGPLDRRFLARPGPLETLKMKGLILYQMSSFCAICTFQWLAHGLLWFLSIVHDVTFDWGLAIILLVVVVRTILHPLTRKSQVSMQRFGKVMGDLKPEIEKLQKKYPDDPKKLQKEQMRMMRERGVNPFQLLGCLPMFLQMPIWVALYAMLYFAIELRQQPAFWGIFQLFGGWPFLADLSAADHCLWEFDEPFHFLIWNMTGINVLPVLMGLVFFFQQKYMSPPPSPSMTKEQLQQQKIMKVMMVVMFPVMLYSAPSGLTLYIFTSSAFGIIEGRYIRRHIKEMDLAPSKPKPHPTPKSKRKPRDPQGRAFADAVERAKAKRKPPPKTFKKRR